MQVILGNYRHFCDYKLSYFALYIIEIFIELFQIIQFSTVNFTKLHAPFPKYQGKPLRVPNISNIDSMIQYYGKSGG